jgi:RloB-like protein
MARSGPVRRPYTRRQRRKRYLLLCEGEETEPTYFAGLRRCLRSSLIEIEVAGEHGDPKRLVEIADTRRKSAQIAARRANDKSLLFDAVWCIFDVDKHERLPEAVQLAASRPIELAISNPCFEVWLLIHFRDQWAYITCSAAYSEVKEQILGYEKKVDHRSIHGRTGAAVERAKAMDARAVASGNGMANPTTGMWKLVSELCKHANVAVDEL